MQWIGHKNVLFSLTAPTLLENYLLTYFLPHITPIWNNPYILSNRKLLFGKTFIHMVFGPVHTGWDVNLWKLLQKMSNVETVSVKSVLRWFNEKVAPRLNQLHMERISFTDKRITNIFIRVLLTKDIFPNQIQKQYILHMFGVEKVNNIRTKYSSYPVPPKIKELQFKIVNEIYLTKLKLDLKEMLTDFLSSSPVILFWIYGHKCGTGWISFCLSDYTDYNISCFGTK